MTLTFQSSENTLFEKLQNFALTAKEIAPLCNSESQTRLSLINPYLEIIGFDVRNPKMVLVEYSTGIGKGVERVDYAIMEGEDPVILIEAKSVTTNLESRPSFQLRRYMIDKDVPFGVMTNGVIYQWFGRDMNRGIENEPFLKHDVTNPTNLELGWLDGLAERLNSKREVQLIAENHSIQNKFLAWFEDNGKNPSDSLLRFILKDLDYPTGKIWIDRSRPLFVDVWKRLFVHQQPLNRLNETEGTEAENKISLASITKEDATGANTPTLVIKMKSVRSQKCWYQIAGGEKTEVSNATLLMLHLLEWAGNQNSDGQFVYFERLSQPWCNVRNDISIIVHQSRYDENFHKKNYSSKFTNSGWRIFNNLDNLGKLKLIDTFLSVCLLKDGRSPERGKDVQIYMPSIPELEGEE